MCKIVNIVVDAATNKINLLLEKEKHLTKLVLKEETIRTGAFSLFSELIRLRHLIGGLRYIVKEIKPLLHKDKSECAREVFYKFGLILQRDYAARISSYIPQSSHYAEIEVLRLERDVAKEISIFILDLCDAIIKQLEGERIEEVPAIADYFGSLVQQYKDLQL